MTKLLAPGKGSDYSSRENDSHTFPALEISEVESATRYIWVKKVLYFDNFWQSSQM